MWKIMLRRNSPLRTQTDTPSGNSEGPHCCEMILSCQMKRTAQHQKSSEKRAERRSLNLIPGCLGVFRFGLIDGPCPQPNHNVAGPSGARERDNRRVERHSVHRYCNNAGANVFRIFDDDCHAAPIAIQSDLGTAPFLRKIGVEMHVLAQ